MKHRYGLVACARWETPYIVEWLNYYRLLGYDHVFLYCNDDDPEELYERVLPFVLGPHPFVTFRHHAQQGEQYQMYLHFMRHHLDDCAWISFIDIDEFLRLPPGETIGDFLAHFGDGVDCMLFNWLHFGPNGHKTRPPGNVLQNFTRRERDIGPYTKFVCRARVITRDWIADDEVGKAFWHIPEGRLTADAKIRNVLGEDARDYYIGFPDRSKRYINDPIRRDRILATAAIHHYALRSERAFHERAERGLGGMFAGQTLWRDHANSENFAGLLNHFNAVRDDSLANFWPNILARSHTPQPQRPPLIAAASQPLAMRPAAALGRPVAPAAFAASRDATVVLHPATTTPVPVPALLNPPQRNLKFTGPIYLLPEIGTLPPDFPRQVHAPDLTLTRLSDIICLPGQIALHHPESDAPPTILMDSLSGPWHGDSVHLDKINDQTFALSQDLAATEDLPGTALYLDNMHSPHFGHFLVDVLSRAWAYEAAGTLGIEVEHVLVERHNAPYIIPLLQACGIPREVIRPVTKPRRCAEVLFATHAFFTQGWTTPTAIALWRKIRDALDQGAGPEKVYISRARTPNRPLRNEAEVEAIFRQRGFYIAHPQELTIAQQVTLWASARLVAGTAGSTMFGLAFQRRLQRALIVNAPNMLQFQELFLQAGHNSETSFYFGEALDGEVHSPWRVAPADLARHVDAWLQNPAPPPPPRNPTRRKADYLALFDEAFYLASYPDVRVAIGPAYPTGRTHYDVAGFAEGRQAFPFEEFWYATTYPEVTNEIASGSFADYRHHYAAIGHLAGCLPRPPAAGPDLARPSRPDAEQPA